MIAPKSVQKCQEIYQLIVQLAVMAAASSKTEMTPCGHVFPDRGFMKSVLEYKYFGEIWVKYFRSYKIDSLVKVMYSPLWGNSQIHENKNPTINECYIKGIGNVMDLIDEDGSMYDFQKLKDMYEIHGTYLDYLH